MGEQETEQQLRRLESAAASAVAAGATPEQVHDRAQVGIDETLGSLLYQLRLSQAAARAAAAARPGWHEPAHAASGSASL